MVMEAVITTKEGQLKVRGSKIFVEEDNRVRVIECTAKITINGERSRYKVEMDEEKTLTIREVVKLVVY